MKIPNMIFKDGKYTPKRMTKKDFKLGELVMKSGKPFGIYAKELEEENLGIYLPYAGIWKLNLNTQKLESLNE